MSKLLRLALSNIRKRRTAALTFGAIVLMSALMLAVSLSLLLNIDSFYATKRAELNSGDILVILEQDKWTAQMENFVRDYPSVTAYQATSNYIGELSFADRDGRKTNQQFVLGSITDIDNARINRINVIDARRDSQNCIYLPLSYGYGGWAVGDKFRLESTSSRYELVIAGFFEDAQMGASVISVQAAFVDQLTFAALGSDTALINGTLLAVQFGDIQSSYVFHTDLFGEFALNSGSTTVLPYELAVSAHTMFASILSLVLVIVSTIVLVIALIIVRFDIRNTISEDMRSLGALKSIGFVSSQLTLAILLQFGMLALFGSVLGVVIASALSGIVGNILTATSGLLWPATSFVVPALVSLVAVCAIVCLVAWLVGRTADTISPIAALRGTPAPSRTTSSRIPLGTTRLPLDWALALKNTLDSIKSHITALVVVVLFGFLTVLSCTLYHNFVVDTSSFVQMLGIEPAHVQMFVLDDADIAIIDQVKAHPKVDKVAIADSFTTTCQGQLLELTVWADIGQKSASNLVAGRLPTGDDEITLMSTAQKMLGVNIGGRITIEYAGVSQSYVVVGIKQGVSSDVRSDLTLQGFERLCPNAVLKGAFVSLFDGKDTDVFIEQMRLDFGQKIHLLNLVDAIDRSLVALADPVAIATYLCIFIAIFTVIFVFCLLVSTIVRRRHHDLGIMKALGCTTRQLVVQMLLSFAPSIILGVLMGTILGIFGTNPLLGLMFGGLGIARATFAIPGMMLVLMEALLVFTCFLTVVFISTKIRKISPQKLLTE